MISLSRFRQAWLSEMSLALCVGKDKGVREKDRRKDTSEKKTTTYKNSPSLLLGVAPARCNSPRTAQPRAQAERHEPSPTDPKESQATDPGDPRDSMMRDPNTGIS